MMKTKHLVVFLTLVVSPALGQDSTATVTMPSCDLNCANGGYCTLREGTTDELQREAQSGKLIEVCACLPGYTGVACENVLEECVMPERKCHNGAPCSRDDNGEWACDCSYADALSDFAGRMCRKPITEYCTGIFEPGEALSFCTNGGRCLGDFIAAQIAPGDTTVNRKYQHAGCSCPPEFYGPHCEFLLMNSLESNEEARGYVRGDGKVQSPATAVTISIMIFAVIVLATLIHRNKRSGHNIPDNISVGANTVISMSDWGLDWGGSIRNALRNALRSEDQYSDQSGPNISDAFAEDLSMPSSRYSTSNGEARLETIHLD